MDHCTPSVVGVGHRKSPLICFISSKPGVDSNQTYQPLGRRGGSMVSALDTGMSGLGLSPGRGHCVVFLGKSLYSQSASLHPGV